jgi:predicted RecA/RadA family phage recombinase
MYERSFMHVETVTHTACAAGDFIITGSKVSVASVSTLPVRLHLTI